MAKVKIINNNLDQNLNGTNFIDMPSNTIFSFGKFFVTSNFDGKTTVTYQNVLSTFVRPVTLETLGITETQSQILHTYSTQALLNLDKSDLNTFVRFGSAYEFLRVSVENIIVAYPGSLFANTQNLGNGNLITTFSGCSYNPISNISTFYVPTACTVNTFGLVINAGNTSIPDNDELKNLNISYAEYVISTALDYNISYPIIGYTGNTINSGNPTLRKYLRFEVMGNPFALMMTGNTGGTGVLDFHIKPNNVKFEEFRALLNPYEKYVVSYRDGIDGFRFIIKNPTLLDDGNIIYSNTSLLWTTSDDYNVDVNTPSYRSFLQGLLTIGAKYDKIKTDLIARFLTPTSLQTYDFTEEGKMGKLLRIYGWEFDRLREFIDSLVYINKVTYDKINNVSDQIVKNMARTFGWDYFSLVNESELVNSFLTIDEQERNLNEDLLPAEIDIELWRRILNNTSYFWKSKGTREAIKSMFLLIGIPEPFINITEYVYTVDGKIDPRTVTLSQIDFPSNSLPYDNSGYPVAPLETNSFYFQLSGNTDGGQAYLDVFRMAGFTLNRTVDNKKSWIQTGATTRQHYSTIQYYQEDSKLVINTKEVDVALDTARGIEYDVYRYIKDIDYPANNSGYTLPYSYVNISLNFTGTQNTFTLPTTYDKTQGDLEVRYNGILLNAPKTGTTDGVLTNADYSVSGNTFTILNGNYAINSGNRRDVIQATFVYSGGTHPVTGISVQYIVTRIKANLTGTAIPLPSYPRGDVQVTINGIALTKGTSQFTADYIVDPNNTIGSSQIIIQNQDVIAFLAANPDVQVSYVEVIGSNNINLRSEIVRIDSFNTGKIYFNNSANKYVFKLNYKANNASEVKFLVDGIALEPYKDYDINVINPYEIFLPKGLKYGTVLSAYYLVGGNELFTPVVSDSFGLGDLSKLSFLEFLELVQRKMINARNRKTISDFKGGWYPTVLKIYEMYLERGLLSTDNPLHSNGYTFENLYPFLSKYNAFFNRFIDQLLSATIILRKGGLLIRNSIFTKQKFTYKRGVNIQSGSTLYDMRGNPMVNYLGDDGSMFQVAQLTPPPPQPIEISIETKQGVAGVGSILNFGGMNITPFDTNNILWYGMQWKESYGSNWNFGYFYSNQMWYTQFGYQPLTANNFTFSTTNTSYELLVDTSYDYRAVVATESEVFYGNALTVTTLPIPVEPVIPSGLTRQNTSSTSTSIVGTGGYAIQGYQDIDWYGMQYCPIGNTLGFNITPTSIVSVSAAGGVCNITVCGDFNNTYTASASTSWLKPVPATPDPPIPDGRIQCIQVLKNIETSARSGYVKYTPTVGSPICVTVSQSAGTAPVAKTVSVLSCTDGYDTNIDVYRVGVVSQPFIGECFRVQVDWTLYKDITSMPKPICVWVTCNDSSLASWCCGYCTKSSVGYGNAGTFGNIVIRPTDRLQFHVCAQTDDTNPKRSIARLSISNVTSIIGTYAVGTPSSLLATTYRTITPSSGTGELLMN